MSVTQITEAVSNKKTIGIQDKIGREPALKQELQSYTSSLDQEHER